jgi:hypothetical protein
VETDRDVEDLLENRLEGVRFAGFWALYFNKGLAGASAATLGVPTVSNARDCAREGTFAAVPRPTDGVMNALQAPN